MNSRQRAQCLNTLRRTFRIDGFRPGQERAVSSLLAGRDLICVLPTGAGKSLCYQLPALIKPGLTLVISPLIALMRDQTARLKSLGIACATLNSQLDREARDMIFRRVQANDLKLLYVSPERLENPAFAALMQSCPPSMIAVDEAHCVVRWGESFRPAYAAIGEFVRSLPVRPVVCAMTATADPVMIRAIGKSLELKRPKQVILPVLRENLSYTVRMTPSRNAALIDAVREHSDGKIIIYCDTRLRTEQAARMLTDAGLEAMRYHAGLSPDERSHVQQAFTENRCRIITATVAFGMGIDIRGVRCVIHDSLPKDVVDYVQQTGRAGRDGEASECILLLSPSALLRRRLKLAASRRAARLKWSKLPNYLRDCRDTSALLRILCGGKCIRQGLMEHFGHRARPCGICSSCRDEMIPHIPSLVLSREKAIVFQCLHIARDAAAEMLGIAPVTAAPKETLRRMAASGCILPEDRVHPDAVPLLQAVLDDAHDV